MKLSHIIEAKYHGLSGSVRCPRCDGRGWEMVQVSEDDVEKDICWSCDGEGKLSKEKALQKGYHHDQLEPVAEAVTLGNDFSSQVRKIIRNVSSKKLHADSFITDMSYGKTTAALIDIFGEPDWESPDYGDDTPYWYINNRTVVVLLDVVSRRINELKTEVTVEYDPDGHPDWETQKWN